jgi:hypothetical protein
MQEMMDVYIVIHTYYVIHSVEHTRMHTTIVKYSSI